MWEFDEEYVCTSTGACLCLCAYFSDNVWTFLLSVSLTLLQRLLRPPQGTRVTVKVPLNVPGATVGIRASVTFVQNKQGKLLRKGLLPNLFTVSAEISLIGYQISNIWKKKCAAKLKTFYFSLHYRIYVVLWEKQTHNCKLASEGLLRGATSFAGGRMQMHFNDDTNHASV